jgi:integrase
MARATKGRVYRRGNSKTYHAEYTINGKTTRRLLRDKDGKPTTSKPTAVKLLHDLLNPLNLKEKQETVQQIAHSLDDLGERIEKAQKDLEPVLKISEAWEAYETAQGRPDTGALTMKDYKGYFSAFETWLKKNHKDIIYLRDITPEIAEKYAASITHAGKSPNTYNKHTGFLKLLFKVLSKTAKIIENPFQEIKRKKKNTQSRRELTVQELLTILNGSTGDLHLLLLIGATTGLRLGDCCTLKWGEVDLVRQVIRRQPNKTARRESSKPVIIGIPEQLLNALSQEPDQTGYVLPEMARRYNTPSLRGGITKQIRKYFEACGIQCHKDGTGKGTDKRAVVEVGFHSLRHTYVSLHAERGTPAAIIQGNVGHGSPAMTAHYTHISDAAAVDVAKVLDFTTGPENVAPTDQAPERAELAKLAATADIEQIHAALKLLKK